LLLIIRFNNFIKIYLILSLFFILSFNSIFSLEEKKVSIPISDKDKASLDCSFAYIYIDSNEQGAGGGHSGILIDHEVYHYQRVFDEFFILDKTEFNTFLFNYSRIQNRNIYVLCIKTQNKHNIKQLKDNLEYIHKKNNYYLYSYLYYDSILKSYKEENFLIPCLLYFSFNEESFIDYLNKVDWINQKWKDFYHYDFSFYLLEKFYDFSLQKNLTINDNYFINIINFKKQINTNIEKHIEFYLNEWEKQNKIILDNPSIDSYLSLLEGKIYQEILKSLNSNSLKIPLMLIEQKNKGVHPLILKSKTLNLMSTKKNYYKNIYIQLNHYIQILQEGIINKDSLIKIQYYLNEITLLSNQILLLENQDNYLNTNIGIMNTPQLYYKNEKLNQYINRIITNEQKKEALDYLKQKLKELKKNQKELFDYHLITKNCVTELILILQINIEDDRLKKIFYNIYNKEKTLSFTFKGNFIPYFSFIELKKMLKENGINFDEYYYPSFRNELLQNKIISNYKEISTITSDIYHLNSNDSFFLFFTENQILMRPIFGIFNSFSSLGKIASDIILLPYDITKNQVYIFKEFRGLFFSLAEVFFISIRKGTFLPYHLSDNLNKKFFQIPQKTLIYQSYTE
jgi:hypothetical protein